MSIVRKIKCFNVLETYLSVGPLVDVSQEYINNITIDGVRGKVVKSLSGCEYTTTLKQERKNINTSSWKRFERVYTVFKVLCLYGTSNFFFVFVLLSVHGLSSFLLIK